MLFWERLQVLRIISNIPPAVIPAPIYQRASVSYSSCAVHHHADRFRTVLFLPSVVLHAGISARACGRTRIDPSIAVILAAHYQIKPAPIVASSSIFHVEPHQIHLPHTGGRLSGTAYSSSRGKCCFTPWGSQHLDVPVGLYHSLHCQCSRLYRSSGCLSIVSARQGGNSKTRSEAANSGIRRRGIVGRRLQRCIRAPQPRVGTVAAQFHGGKTRYCRQGAPTSLVSLSSFEC